MIKPSKYIIYGILGYAILLGIITYLSWVIFVTQGYNYSLETGIVGGPNVVLSGTLSEALPNEISERLLNKLPPFHIAYFINKNPIFKEGTGVGTLSMENPPESQYDVRYSVYLLDGMHIYTSPLLEPAQYLTSATLERSLPAGEHLAMGYTSFYAEDTYIGRHGTEIVITVLQ